MAVMQQHVAYLAETIGARPAGTEEEQQASFYIAEHLEKDAQLTPAVENFNCNPDADLPKAIAAAVAIVVSIVGMLVPFLVIPACILAAVATALYVGLILDHPLLSRILDRGVSQNVVAKYTPPFEPETGATRRRKVVLVAHYDTGRVQQELRKPILGILPILQWVGAAGVALCFVFLLIRIFAAGGALNVLTVIACICALLPLIQTISYRVSPYVEGANCNAAGVAVLMEVAERISKGHVGADGFGSAVMHGADVLAESGYIPEGASVDYEGGASDGSDGESAGARLLSAKAAIAALSGKPVSDTIHVDLADNLVKVGEPPIDEPTAEAMEARRAENMVAFAPVDVKESKSEEGFGQEVAVGGVDAADEAFAQAIAADEQQAAQAEENLHAEEASLRSSAPAAPAVPDWFAAAQAKARKVETNEPIHRSRYADALAAAESALAERAPEEPQQTETQLRLQEMRDSIMGYKPGDHRRASEALAAADEAQNLQRDAADGSSSGKESRIDELVSRPTVAEAEAQGGGAVEGFLAATMAARDNDGEQDATFEERRRMARAEEEAKEGRTIAFTPVKMPVNESAVPASDAAPIASAEDETAKAASAHPDHRTVMLSASAAVTEQIPSAAEPPVAAATTTTTEVASKRRMSAPAAPASEGAESGKKPTPRKRRSISLPDIGSDPTLEPLDELRRQPAPLAEERPASSGRVRNLASLVPSIKDGDAQQDQGSAVPAVQSSAKADERAEARRGAATAPEGGRSALRSLVPSLSGTIPAIEADESAAPSSSARFSAVSHREEPASALEEEKPAVSTAGAFATGTFEPIGDDLVEAIRPDEVYIDDADDSDYETNMTPTGAYSGVGYVDMPKSRLQTLFGKFGFGRKKRDSESVNQWLDVDDEFDAREVGKARGDWESFRQDDEDYEGGDEFIEDFEDDFLDDYETDYDDGFDDDETDDQGRPWLGGGFSRESLGRVSTLSGADSEEEQGSSEGAMDDYAVLDEALVDPRAAIEEATASTAALLADLGMDATLPAEEEIASIRQGSIRTEVWFVALGSQLAANGGTKAFLQEHEQDLRGAIIIDLDGLGAGALSLIDIEGSYFPRKASSRMDRLVRKASSALGMKVDKATMKWRDSASAYALKRGFQAMHLAGMADGKPAHFAQADDTVEAVDEALMQDNADFVIELIKKI